MHPNQQVARRATVGVQLAPPRQANHHPIIDAGGNLYLERMRREVNAGAPAGGAGRLDQQAPSSAAGAGRRGDDPHALAGPYLFFMAGP